MLQWLDTLMGLVVILLGVSLVIMILTQIISALLNLRGTNLKKGIQALLENTDPELKDVAKEISEKALSHPLISDRWGKVKRWRLASTIRPDELVNILKILADSETYEWCGTLQRKLQDVQNNINTWMDNTMDRVSQHFNTHTRFVTVAFSLIVALALHLDAFQLFNQISTDAEFRASLVASADAMLKRTEEVVGKSPVPGVYLDVIAQMKLQDSTATGLEMPPETIKSREAGVAWLENQLAGSAQKDSLINRYGELIDKNLVRSIDQLNDRASSIIGELQETKFKLVPEPYHGWDYALGERHLWGVLVMAALLGLGAPFWFNALKTLSSLRPILAGKEDKEREERTTSS